MQHSTAKTTQGNSSGAVTTPDVARAAYQSIPLYSPNRTPAKIDLSDNTNLWGVPPHALREIHTASTAAVTRYPGRYSAGLKSAIADYLDVTPGMVVTGCGSDDVLDSALRAFGDPGDIVAVLDPSFAMIPIFSMLNGLHPVGVPLTATFDADAEGILATNAKIIYLCSPNNPTGKALQRWTIERIVDEAQGVVIIDEAYAEFARANCLELLRRSPRVLITRTLSKAFGLAGLRVGYAVGDPTLVREVEKSRGPYKVNTLAERAAIAALTEDRVWVDLTVREALENRAGLVHALRDMELSPISSDANFVLVPVDGAAQIDQRMRERGVAVRPFEGLRNIGDALRISVGPWALLEECLSVLREVLGHDRTQQPEQP